MEASPSLERFVLAQEKYFSLALAEISQGQKQSHWMWYIFPQVRGLGSSDTSRFYAIQDVKEAQAYLEHPLLGSRLIHISRTLLGLSGIDAHQIFGSPDDFKLRSSMTLFSALPHTNPIFQAVLDKYFNGAPDPATMHAIGRS